MLVSTDLEDVYNGPDLTNLKKYFEQLEDDNKSDDRCMDSQSVDTYNLFDLQFPYGIKGDQITEAEVFGLKPYKTLVTSYQYGFELFKETIAEVKCFLQER